MQTSVVQALKTQLLNVVLEKDPEASIQIFAMAAMHGDIDTLNLIIDRIGDRLGNLEEMILVRDALAEIIKKVDAEEARQKQAEAAAAEETQELMKKLGL